MKNQAPRKSLLFVVLISIIFIASACRANLSRSQDGSLLVETTVSQPELQEVVTASIADPLIKQLSVSFQSGYVLVTGQRQRLNDASKTDTLSLRLDLGISNGQLTATVSNAQLDGIPVEQNRVDHWNQTIANRITIIGKKRPNSTLEMVSITPDSIDMTWKVSK